MWGPYLQARAERVERLADALRWEVRSHHRPPDWLGPMSLSPRMFENGALLGDISVWRAVMDVPASDLRPTGAPAVGEAAARWQRDLDARLDRSLGMGEWGRLLPTLDPALAHGPGAARHRAPAPRSRGEGRRRSSSGRARARGGTAAG